MSNDIRLPQPSQKGRMSLEEAIALRRSIRGFSAQPISRSQLSQVLWAAQGATDASWGSRAAPSAGATYPLEVYVVCGSNGINGIGAGVYRYAPDSHSLALHYQGDARPELARAALDQESISDAPLDIVVCAVYERTVQRYGERGERYVHMEVGHAGQNIYLEATALGLATVAIGAFDDDAVREALRLDRQRTPLYIMPLGKPADAA